jgi:hypothetical protein
MALFRRAPATPDDPAGGLSQDGLLTPEDIAERRQRRSRFLKLALAVALAAGVWCGARPALHVIKAWQSRRAAAQAERFTQEGKFFEAKTKVQDALALWRHEPAAARAAALFLGATGNFREAADFWKEVAAARPLTAGEQSSDAAALLAVGDLVAAEMHLRQAWPPGAPGEPADWDLGMKLAARCHRDAAAADLARRLLASRAATTQERFEAAGALISGSDAAARRAGWDEMRELAKDRASAESLDALVLLARQAEASAQPEESAELSALVARIDAHPLARIQHHLLALDLTIAQAPNRRAALIQSAIDRFAGTRNDAELATLAGWLYGKEDYEQVLQVVPAARAPSDRALFFQRLDALGALGRWNEIQDAILSRKLVLDPMIEQMYLARCADKLDEPRARDVHWDAAIDAAAGNAEKLLQLGQYAAKNGATGVAGKALRAAVQAAPASLPVQRALSNFYEAEGDTRKMQETIGDMLKIAPQDLEVRNEAAYLDALLGERIPEALATARALVRADPSSLPYRVTLALAELRSDNAMAAYDAFAGINAGRAALQPRQIAVYAAMLWAASYNVQAQQAVSTLPLDQLLPEERALIKPIQDAPAL